MCTALLACPLCSLPRFDDLESLRISLIKVATESLVCPICDDILMGLDKLTIHLFSHRETNKCNVKQIAEKNEENSFLEDVQDCEKSHFSMDDNSSQSSRESSDNSKRKSQNSSMSVDTSNNETQKKMDHPPVFNMNPIPFIGIPKNLTSELTQLRWNRTNKNTEKRKIKNERLSEKCDICGFYFLGKNILEMHKKLIHNIHNSEIVNGTSQYCCHLCSKIFKMRGSLMVHLRMVHFRIIPSVENDEELPIKIKCHISKSESSNNCDLNLEETEGDCGEKKDSLTAVDCEKSIDSFEIICNANNGAKQWTCDICSKNFTTKYFLKKHKRLHTGEMPYSCTQCNKTFTFQQSYHKHLLYHNDEKPHSCSHCGRSFKELSTLHNHQRIHTGEKPFSCETCGKCFRQRVSYLVHRRIHTGAMPYKCTACDKSFRYKVSQRTHKCTAQPPGTVVRQSGDLVQKLMKNQIETGHGNLSDSDCRQTSVDEKHVVPNADCKTAKQDFPIQLNPHFLDNIYQNSFSDHHESNFHFNEKQIEEKNIFDEIVNESISKIDFSDPKPSTSHGFDRIADLYSMMSPAQDADENLPSPSEKLKNLKLSPSVTLNPEEMLNENLYGGNSGTFVFGTTISDNFESYVKDRYIEFAPNNFENRDTVSSKR